MKKFLILFLFLLNVKLFAQVPEPVNDQTKPVLIYNAFIHIGDGNTIQNGFVSFDNGKITDVRSEYLDLESDTYNNFLKINANGSHLYPGLILPNSKVGLEDISAVRATVDHTEVGELNSNIRSLIAFNTDSEVISTFRYNGILISQVVPDGSFITGNSSIMMMEGWNWEDAAYKIDDGLHVKWPRKTYPPSRWSGQTSFRDNPNYKPSVDMINKFLIDSRSYFNLNGDENKEVNLKLEAMVDVFNGKKKIYLHVGSREQIIESVQMFQKHGINNLVLVGANDALYAIDFILENDLPVLLNNLHRVPSRNHEDIDLPYKLPYLLQKEGVLVGLTASGSLHSQRNLPFLAGTAAGYGLGKEEALKLITSNNAKILGIDNVTGTIKVGKDANIIISKGDILDMKSSVIEYAFITGRKVNLDGKQQILYDRFMRKYSN